MKISAGAWIKARKCSERAFSLVEVVLAIGIAAFALVGILGLLPMAMDSAAANQIETRAVCIAHSTIAGLEADADTKPFLVKGVEIGSSRVTWVDLAKAGANFLAFDENGCAEDESITENDYISGRPGSEFLARLTVSTNGLLPGLSTVEVAITAPGIAPLPQRRRYTFVTQLLQN